MTAHEAPKKTYSAITSLNNHTSLQFGNYNWDLAMNRYLTFPADYTMMTGILREDLANSGLRLNEDNEFLICHYCPLKISCCFVQKNLSKTEIDEIHISLSPSCALFTQNTKNVPLEASDGICYNFEACRLHSFLQYGIWKSCVSIYELARSGFYYTAEEDNCRCAFCKLEVRGWEPSDTADGEHRRWNPNCPFLQGKSLGNVPVGEELSASSVSASGSLLKNPFIKNFDVFKYSNQLKLSPRRGQVSIEALGIIEKVNPRFPRFATYSSRLQTYKPWPKSMPQKANELAAAGLFYNGVGDRVCCFQCGLGLKDWATTDDPWREHITWNPNCQFALIVKDKEFIRRPVQQYSNSSSETVPVETQRTSDIICGSCRRENIDLVNLPCGHMEHCSRCTSGNKCQKCQQPVLGTLKIFLN